jgi:hypothetical protein
VIARILGHWNAGQLSNPKSSFPRDACAARAVLPAMSAG